ncbi:MAG: Asp-tRNA(Asn)/Glu-tRNA(Gln) amidotransferase subunit GatC [Myxococcaceae bacterium]
MQFSHEDMTKLARLSRLALSEDELSARQRDLEQILSYVQTLQAIDVSEIKPMTHAVPMELHLRPDEPKPGVGRLGLMGSAGYEDGLIKVPKIIE